MDTQDFYCDYVLNNKLEVKKVMETGDILAFYHTKPSHRIHIVIIPKQHITQLTDVEDMSIIQKIFEAILQVVAKLDLKTFRIVTNSGEYQDSKHLHFHLIAE